VSAGDAGAGDVGVDSGHPLTSWTACLSGVVLVVGFLVSIVSVRAAPVLSLDREREHDARLLALHIFNQTVLHRESDMSSTTCCCGVGLHRLRRCRSRRSETIARSFSVVASVGRWLSSWW